MHSVLFSGAQSHTIFLDISHANGTSATFLISNTGAIQKNRNLTLFFCLNKYNLCGTVPVLFCMKEKHLHNNPDYIHHKNSPVLDIMREIIFGVEDGMVSTMGAITGIAAGTGNHFLVVLSGVVIIAVESISMAVGSYVSNKSEQQIQERKLAEEREEIKQFPEGEADEMFDLFVADGWPADVAKQMTSVTVKDKELMLREMAYRELRVFPDTKHEPLRGGVVMGISYIIGGSVPLLPYLFFDIKRAVPFSIGLTLVGLFALGGFASRYSKRNWVKAGLEMLVLAGIAAIVGYFAGQFVEMWNI